MTMLTVVIDLSAGPGRGDASLVLLGFLASFLFIRTSARMIRAEVSWWPGNVETKSGLHLHHLVWGISLMLISGFLGFALAPAGLATQIAAVMFGIGAGLALDEFALWVHLDDVYWTDEGRASLDAVVIATVFMALVVIGLNPFGLEGSASAAAVAFTVAQAIVLAVIAFLKGRITLGVVALFIPLTGLWATCRLAKPASPWSHHFYGEAKLERARRRFPADRRGTRTRDRVFDAIGGRPSEPGSTA